MSFSISLATDFIIIQPRSTVITFASRLCAVAEKVIVTRVPSPSGAKSNRET